MGGDRTWRALSLRRPQRGCTGPSHHLKGSSTRRAHTTSPFPCLVMVTWGASTLPRQDRHSSCKPAGSADRDRYPLITPCRRRWEPYNSVQPYESQGRNLPGSEIDCPITGTNNLRPTDEWTVKARFACLPVCLPAGFVSTRPLRLGQQYTYWEIIMHPPGG